MYERNPNYLDYDKFQDDAEKTADDVDYDVDVDDGAYHGLVYCLSQCFQIFHEDLKMSSKLDVDPFVPLLSPVKFQ